MTKFKHILLAAALAVPGAFAAPAATAQVSGIAVADPEAAVANSRAWTTARTQIQTTYKAQLDQANTRQQAIENELRPLAQAFETARSQPNANEASLRTQAQTLQQRQQAAQQELGRLTAPAQRAQAYAIEQITNRLQEAVQAAVRARNVQLLLRPNAALFNQPAADVTSAITAELDRLVPTVSITPPANWQPGQQQQAQPAPAAAAQPAPAARPQGR